MKKKKIVIIIAIIGLFLIIPIIIFTIYKENSNKSYIQFYTSPNTVNILIDNTQKKSIKNKDKILLPIGQHTIIVSRNGFESYTRTVTIKTNQLSSFIVILTGITDEAKKEVKNETTTEVKEAWAGQTSNDYSKDILKKYPLIQYLPYSYQSNGLIYKITPEFSTNNLKYIKIFINTCSISSMSQYKTNALDWIKSKSINPSDYIIKYSTPCNNSINL